MVGDEPHLPYTRPPLSKEVLAGEHEVERVHFPCDTLDAEWRLGVSARSLDRSRRRVLWSLDRASRTVVASRMPPVVSR